MPNMPVTALNTFSPKDALGKIAKKVNRARSSLWIVGRVLPVNIQKYTFSKLSSIHYSLIPSETHGQNRVI
jgi:hypothetical protein